MSDNMFICIAVTVALLIGFLPMLNIRDKHAIDKISKLEQRIEKLEKIVTYIEMK